MLGESHFKSIQKKFTPQNDNILLVIEFIRKFEIFLPKFIKKIMGDSIGESNNTDGI